MHRIRERALHLGTDDKVLLRVCLLDCWGWIAEEQHYILKHDVKYAYKDQAVPWNTTHWGSYFSPRLMET